MDTLNGMVQAFVQPLGAGVDAVKGFVGLFGTIPICVCCPWCPVLYLAFIAPGVAQATPAWATTSAPVIAQAAQDSVSGGTAHTGNAATQLVRSNEETVLGTLDPISTTPRAVVATSSSAAQTVVTALGSNPYVTATTRPGSTSVSEQYGGQYSCELTFQATVPVGAPALQ